MWVKICGITRLEDALAAVELGADAVGFVFTRSKRRADSNRLKQWMHQIQGIEKVGVFTNEDPHYIDELARELGLDSIQLHSGPSAEHRNLAKRFRIIYALREVKEDTMPDDLQCRILIDPSQGSGMKGTWRRLGIPFILAGGLDPDNVREAIEKADPAGVDVSSGVEIAPGIKDIELMRRFIQEARA
jgi:phosphoribosylanthranilate isomerase